MNLLDQEKVLDQDSQDTIQVGQEVDQDASRHTSHQEEMRFPDALPTSVAAVQS